MRIYVWGEFCASTRIHTKILIVWPQAAPPRAVPASRAATDERPEASTLPASPIGFHPGLDVLPGPTASAANVPSADRRNRWSQPPDGRHHHLPYDAALRATPTPHEPDRSRFVARPPAAPRGCRSFCPPRRALSGAGTPLDL